MRDDITDMNNGFVVVIGKLTDLNTNGLGNGTQLYLSPTTAGTYTVTKPIAPEHLVYVGVVVRDHPTQGVIEVKIQNGYELDEIHDVNPNLSVTTPIDADSLLIQDSAVSIWKKLSWSNLKTTIKTYLDTFYQDKITLTTTGTSGASTLVGSTLNIPQYAGGLSYFTEAQNITAPNATVNVDSLTAVASTTNADFAIRPKGTGAFTLAIPDSTATGGDKRGANAIDLQTARSNANQVASGNNSVVIGVNSRASSNQAVAIGTSATASGVGVALNSSGDVTGSNATASNTGAFAINGGQASGLWSFAMGRAVASNTNAFAFGAYYTSATASGEGSVAIGGNTASSFGAVAIGGQGNLASGFMSYAFGNYTSTNGIIGRQSRGYALTPIQGETQKSEFFLSKRTTDATATTLTVNGGVANTTNQVILSNQSAYRFKGTIIGKVSGTTGTSAWDIDGLIVRGANAGSTTLLVGNVNVVYDGIIVDGPPVLSADTTNGGLRVQVIGSLANIQWTAVIETTEVIYA